MSIFRSTTFGLLALACAAVSNPAAARYLESDPIGQAAGPSTYGYVGGNPLIATDRFGLDIDYANHEVAGGIYHSFLLIIPNNQGKYANDPRFQNINANGDRFATIGAGPAYVGMDMHMLGHLVAGINRPKDVGDPIHLKKKLELPCRYKTEDQAIDRLFELEANYNKHPRGYTLFPVNFFGLPLGTNSNSFVSGIGNAAGFDMPQVGTVGVTPGYQNPVSPDLFQGP
jgi:hypothetical protein